MPRYMKHALAVVVLSILMVGLLGCGDSLKKPTGLEPDTNDEQSEPASLAEKTPEDKNITLSEAENEKDADSDADQGDAPQQEQDTPADQTKNNETNEDAVQDQKAVEKPGAKNNKTTSNSSKDASGKSKTTSQQTNKSNDQPSDDKKDTTDSDKKQPSNQDNNKNKDKDKDKQENEKPVKPKQPSVTHSIVIAAEGSDGQQWCKDNPGKGGCPTDGSAEVPLPPVNVDITEEETVLDVLIRVTKARKIQMDYRGGQGATAYVEGIRNVYEFDRGQGSGWMYSINGVFSDRGAGAVPLCDGDRVEWLYTNNLGKDLGADLKPVRRDGKCPN